jgi:PhnB protein
LQNRSRRTTIAGMNLDASVSLSFNGECEAAFTLYESLLGAKAELVITWGASPLANDVPREWHEKMLFARLRCRTMTLLGADAPPGRYQPPAGFTLCLSADDEAEAERLFAALAEGGTVRMALQATFFAARYGEVVDRFRIPWEIRCRKPHGGANE